MTHITRDWVCLAYALMAEEAINVGAMLKSTMKKARLQKDLTYSFGGLMNSFLRSLDVEKEVTDYRPLQTCGEWI